MELKTLNFIILLFLRIIPPIITLLGLNMIQRAFNSIYQVFLSNENSLPINASDMKLVKIVETNFQSKTATDNFYVLDSNTKRFYKAIEFNNDTASSVHLEYELGKIVFQIFLFNLFEMVFRIVYEIYKNCSEIILILMDLDPAYAAMANFFQFADLIKEIGRIVWYSIGVQVAAFEGVFLNPARAFVKIADLEASLNYEASKEDATFGQQSSEESWNSWYSTPKLCFRSLEEQAFNGNMELQGKFEIIEEYQLAETSNEPLVFPLPKFCAHKIEVFAIYSWKQMIETAEQIRDFTLTKLHQTLG